MTNQKPARFRRFLAFGADWIFSFLIVMPLMFAAQALPAGAAMFLGACSTIGVFVLFFCRDYLLSGRSIGKRLLGLAVVDRDTGAPATGRQLILKNLFFFLYPIDCGFLLFSGRSLGERATRTAVIRSSEPVGPVVKKRLAIAAAVILAIAVPFSLLMQFMMNSVKETEGYRIAYDYLAASGDFAQIDLTGFSGHTQLTEGQSVTTNEYTFRADGEQYVVVCHPSEDGWQVCDACTEFE